MRTWPQRYPGVAFRPERRFALTESVIAAALSARAFPGAVVEVGRASGILWQYAAGHLTYDAESAPATLGTMFDLASLTKVVATTSLVARHAAAGLLALDAPLGHRWAAWGEPPRDTITVRHLLDHSSGLPAHLRLWEHHRGRLEYAEALAGVALDRAVGTSAIYSDLGFILLGFLLEDLAGPLDRQVAELVGDLGAHPLSYNPPATWHAAIAPTEFDVWRDRLLRGEVHDENAAALDGVAGHAGLFGTAAAVGAFARTVLATFAHETPLGSPALMRVFANRSHVPGSSRALGWDTMLPTSSCGSRLSARAIGHTGFTGTSLWVDPEQDLYVVLLTNRVYPTRANDGIRGVRPRVHDAVIEDLR